MGLPLLEVKGLKAYYRTRAGEVKAVDGVSFSVEPKEIFGIAGESGCGKSTLGMALLRLVDPPCYVEAGDVLFDGVDLLELDAEGLRTIRWKRFSYIPQSSMNALNPVARIGSQIVDAIAAHEHLSEKEANKRVAPLLKGVGLAAECADMYPHELSGGMKQRAIIAMAMALGPQLILADEPTTALDVNVQRVVLQALAYLREAMGVSVILVTHDMAAQAEIADRLAIMYAGKIVEVGAVDDVFADPLHPYTQGLMSAIPSLAEKRQIKSIPGYPPNLLDPPPGCRFHPRCPVAVGRCREEQPELRSEARGRLVACHLVVE